MSSWVRSDRPARTVRLGIAQAQARSSYLGVVPLAEQRLQGSMRHVLLVDEAALCGERPGLTASVLLLQQLPCQQPDAHKMYQLRHDEQVVMILDDLQTSGSGMLLHSLAEGCIA